MNDATTNLTCADTKPRQEQRALLNLTQQGYDCYLAGPAKFNSNTTATL